MILGQYVIFGYYMRINKDFRATEFTFERNLSAVTPWHRLPIIAAFTYFTVLEFKDT